VNEGGGWAEHAEGATSGSRNISKEGWAASAFRGSDPPAIRLTASIYSPETGLRVGSVLPEGNVEGAQNLTLGPIEEGKTRGAQTRYRAGQYMNAVESCENRGSRRGKLLVRKRLQGGHRHFHRGSSRVEHHAPLWGAQRFKGQTTGDGPIWRRGRGLLGGRQTHRDRCSNAPGPPGSFVFVPGRV